MCGGFNDKLAALNYHLIMRFYLSVFVLIFASGVSYGQTDKLPTSEFDQFNLGVQYDKGFGVSKNYEIAVVWYAKAAGQGNTKAQNNLGTMYEDGRGVVKNDTTAVKWYTKAAEQGNKAAQNNLGFMYAKGKGVTANNVKAYMWWNLAILNGSADAENKKKIIIKKMTKEQIERAQDLSERCLANSYKDC
jgi:hypothetical protein